jgi:hypothetical protein
LANVDEEYYVPDQNYRHPYFLTNCCAIGRGKNV